MKLLLAIDHIDQMESLIDAGFELVENEPIKQMDFIYVIEECRNHTLQDAPFLKAGAEELKRLMEPLNSRSIRGRAVNLSGDAAKTIVAYANKYEYDFILLGKQRSSPFYKWFEQKASDYVIRNVNRPVLVVTSTKISNS